MADDTTTSALALQPDFSAETPRPERAPLSGIEDPVPLFAQPERRFATAQGIAGIEAVPGGARVEVATQDGRPAELLVQRTRSGALRLRWSCPPGAPGTVRDTDGMLAEGADPDPTAAVELCDGALTLDAPTWRFELEPDMSWTLRRPDGTQLTAQRRDDGAFSHWMSRPLGTSRGEGLRTWAHESLVLAPEERIYGLGQQYGPVDKRGMRIVQYNRDAIGSNGTLITYHNTPFCWSSAGYGLVVHAAGRVMWELGNPSFETLTVAAAGEVLDLFVLAGDTPQALLDAFYALSGPPATVPDWALGIWMSRCMYSSRAEVVEVVRNLEAIGFPLDVVHLDPRWMRERRTRDNDHGADLTWDDAQFGDPRSFFATMRDEGRVRVSLWENPYALVDSWTHSELESLGGLARQPGHDFAPPFEAPQRQAHVVDFTGEPARRWWAAQHLRLLDLGAAAFKTDFAEGVPDDAQFADGRSGADIHNLYALLFNRLVFETTATRTDRPVVFGRSGWLGSHRYPLQWSGDAQCTWSDLRGALRAGLSAALSGTAYWASDIGGFYTMDQPLPDGELYARWAWLGCLSPIARFHGTSPREPYVYAPEVCAAAVAAARLRYALMPYLAEQSRRTLAGRPMLRPLVLDFPDDVLCWREDSSFLLGEDLLVAPVVKPGGRRRVHLPRGRWGDWWTGEVVEGPTDLDLSVPLDRVPLYQREGSLVSLGEGRRVEDVLRGPVRRKAFDEPYRD
ncbi:MAG TPA: TIM-barrel domain-containing protein [Candidatus Dormibacteraeota bacterium]|nr:TIM-barrel domain-containing protein [Candidatus Dormibacteraeota bacterium]